MESDLVSSRSPSRKSWRDAVSELYRSALRHKLVSGLVAVAVFGSLAAIVAVGVSGSGTGAASSSDAGSASWAVRPAGSPAAQAFSLPRLGGSGQISLAQYAGQPLIVNFFASWCTPCKAETPMLARFYRARHGSVALVGIDGNDVTSNALRFAKASGIGYPVGWDPQVSLGLAYGVNGIPQTFFLDARHRIVYRVFGAVTPAQLTTGLRLLGSPAAS